MRSAPCATAPGDGKEHDRASGVEDNHAIASLLQATIALPNDRNGHDFDCASTDPVTSWTWVWSPNSERHASFSLLSILRRRRIGCVARRYHAYHAHGGIR